MDEEYDCIVLGTGLTECILSGTYPILTKDLGTFSTKFNCTWLVHLLHNLAFRNALCVWEESSTHGQVFVCLSVLVFCSFDDFCLTLTLWLSGTSTMVVNLPPWHLLRNSSPSLGFLLLMRAMEGEGKLTLLELLDVDKNLGFSWTPPLFLPSWDEILLFIKNELLTF